MQEGVHYRHKIHNSLIIKDNVYYWNSQHEHGNAVDWVMRRYNLTFPQAVQELTGNLSEEIINGEGWMIRETPKVSSFSPVVKAPNEKRVLAYLVQTRHISFETVSNLIKQGFLYQDEKGNVVFPMFGKQGVLVGEELEGTLSTKRFKRFATGSDCRYGYSVPMSEDKLQYALFFESSVDLLSFIDLSKINNKPLTGCVLVSMGGLKLKVIQTTLETYGEGLKCVLCVDNDVAGENFKASAKTQIEGVLERVPIEPFKDWNEQLKAMKG